MPEDPFVVNVARLRRVPGTRWHEVRRGPVDTGPPGPGSTPPEGASSTPPEGASSMVPEGADATCDVTLQSFDGGVMVAGTVGAPWQGLCRRCTVPVGGELRIAVRERFADVPAAGHGGPPGAGRGTPAGDEPEDDEAYPIVDDRLDLRPMVRDALVLELPLAPLCRDDCRGLCPRCGADRNVEACGCVAPRDPRWANLDVLRSVP
jgi:uncharacterized protein